ncbi:DUF3822 family protein [Joostella sp. CR20]|uniref:DUF3822 family protein n=1 Tax=Joostella sp. CR20 TaxID=2804312 RepID=UPI00313A8436
MTQNKTSNILNNSFKELSIQVSLSGLSFCILNGASHKIELLETLHFDQKANPEQLISHLEAWFSEEKIATDSLDKVSVVHENELSSFIPKSLFNERNLSDYLKYNVKILENDFISYDELKSYDIYNVYVPFANVNNYIFDKFGDFEYKHASSILVETLINSANKSNQETIYVYVSKSHFEIVVLNQKKLIHYNTFTYQQKEDFIYYLLFTIEQLNLNPEETPTLLLGDITEESDLYKIAYTYIKHLSINNKQLLTNTYSLPKNTNSSNFYILLNSL